MKRAVLLAAVVAALMVPQAQAGGWTKSMAAAQKQANAKKQFIFVELFAQWCGWCHRFEQEVAPSEAFQKSTDNMVLLRLDTEDGGEGTKFARQYQVSSLPTFLLLAPDLTIAGVLNGYAPSTQFAQRIDDAIAKYRDFQKRASQESTFAIDYQKRLDLAREFRMRLAYPESERRFKKLTTEKGMPEGIRDQAWYDLGVQYLLQKRYDDVTKVIADFGKVQTKGESYERARLLASDVCIAKGNFRCAADELRKFKATFPQSKFIPNVEIMLPQIEQQISARQ